MLLKPEEVGLLKRRLLAKESETNAALTRALAGKPVDLEPLLGEGALGATAPEEKLIRFLGLIGERLRDMHEGRLGRCQACGGEISFAELVEVPWRHECRHCGSLETPSPARV